MTTPPTTAPPADQEATGDRPHAVILSVDGERVARRVLLFCVLAELALFLLDYHVNYGRATNIGAIRRLFNTAREDGLASWFGTTQTLLAALTLWLTYLIARTRPKPQWWKTAWLALALFFTYMAIDDGAELHERLGTTVDALKEDSSALLAAFPSYTWQVLFLPFFGAFGLFMLVFLWKEIDTRSSRLVLVSAIGCLVLAVVLDFFEGLEPDHALNLHTYIVENTNFDARSQARFARSGYDTLQHFSRSTEETLEMLANSLLLFLFLRNLPHVSSGGLQIRFEPKQD